MRKTLVYSSFRASESIPEYLDHREQGCFWDEKGLVRLGGQIAKALKAGVRGLGGFIQLPN